jgi:hypothetical protein
MGGYYQRKKDYVKANRIEMIVCDCEKKPYGKIN